MRTWIKVFLGCLILFFLTARDVPAENEGKPTDRFLRESGIWVGEFTNFVNQDGGLIQRGEVRMKVTVGNDGIITQGIALIRPDGTVGDYQGYTKLKVEGNTLEWVGSVTKDENTGNPIENHVFKGYVGWNQIYAVEKYEEVFPDGRRERRRNNLHYIFLDKEKMLWLADVYLNDQLLVFANTILELQE